MRKLVVFLCMLMASAMPGLAGAQQAGPATRALSLKVLQDRLNDCSNKKQPCPKELLELGGLTRVDGFLHDEKNSDIVVFGVADPYAPPIRTEDFAIALRNAWFKYAEQKGDTIYYSNPGCSIDMDPALLIKINALEHAPQRSNPSGGFDKQNAQFFEVCRMPQKVRVLGIPFQSHFAWVMVEADYYMKRLTNGSVSMGIKGCESVMEMRLASASERLKSGQPLEGMSFNRFWFYPGENLYRFDGDTVYLDRCPVILLTEAQYLSKERKIQGTGKVDHFAAKFADSFTDHYSEIAQKEPLYQELAGLFRLVAISKIMKSRNIDQKGDITYLLGGFPVPETKVAAALPGIADAREIKARSLAVCLQSCGGVGIDIEATQEHFRQDEELQPAKEAILAQRPSLTALFWDFVDSFLQRLAFAGVGSIFVADQPSGAAPAASQPGRRPDEEAAEPRPVESRYDGTLSPFPGRNRERTNDKEDLASVSMPKDEASSAPEPAGPLRERKKDAITAAANLKNAVAIDFFVDVEGKSNVYIADSRGKVQTLNMQAATIFRDLLEKTAETRGKFSEKVLNAWEAFNKEYLAGSVRRTEITLPTGKKAVLKPLLLIRSNEMDFNYTNLERIPALVNNFLIVIASKADTNGRVIETPNSELSERIKKTPSISRKNVVFAIRPPRTGMTQENIKEWGSIVNRLEELVGKQHVLFNPSKDEFTGMLKKSDKEIIVIELTHTTNSIMLKDEETFSSADLEQMNLSHIKYLLTGMGSCSLPRLESGQFVAALKRCGINLVNASYREISNDIVVKRLHTFISILENPDKYDFPAYYLLDVIDQMIDVTGSDTTNLGKLEKDKEIVVVLREAA